MSTESNESPQHQRFRQGIFDRIPASYRPGVHLLQTAGSCLAVVIFSLINISDSTWLEWLIVSPIVLIYANFFEYFIHRRIFHEKHPPLVAFYNRHREHHQLFYEGTMFINSTREIFHVLMPWYAIVSFFFLAGGAALLVGILISSNVGWIVFFWQGSYVFVYEILHLLYHFPVMNEFVVTLRNHHATHHHRAHSRENFNITWRLWDRIRGTLVKSTPQDPTNN